MSSVLASIGSYIIMTIKIYTVKTQIYIQPSLSKANP